MSKLKQPIDNTNKNRGGQAMSVVIFATLLPLSALAKSRRYGSSMIRILGTRPDYLMVERRGFEPRTPCLQSRCSSQLSYRPSTGVFYLIMAGYSRWRLPVLHLLLYYK